LSLNGNLYVGKRSIFTADVSMNGNVKLGSSVAVNKDISSAFALDVSGITNLRNNLFVLADVSFGTKLFVSGDSSFNSNLSVGNDLSLNGNLYVGKRSVFTADVSMNGNVKLGSSVAVNKDISSAFALDVSGITNLRNNLFVLADVSFGTKLFVSGDSSFNRNLSVGNDLSLNGNLYVVKRALFTADVSMNGNVKHGSSVSINKDISSAFALDVSGITNLRNNLFVLADVSFGTKLFVSGDSSFNGNLSVGTDLSLNGNLYVVKRSVFTADVSMNGNLDIGSGSSSVAINKDISSAFALDVSGITNLRNNLFVLSDVSFGTKLFVSGDSSFNSNLSVGNDLSLNGNLYVVKRALFTADVSMNGNVKHGSSVSINKDISSAFALDVSGITNLRNNLFVLADVSFGTKLFVSGDSSFNGNLSVGNDLSLNGSLYVVKRALFTADVSMNGNVKLGSGLQSVSINKDISSAFALDVSGITNLRNNLFVLSDVSFGTKLFVSGDSSFNRNLSVGNDLSLNGNLYVVKRSVFTLDVSMNGNVKLGSGLHSVAVNKDISSAFALDVSGITNLRNNLFVLSDVSFGTKLFVSGDSSFNGNLSVGQDLSLNGNLYVVKRSVFRLDVSMNGNVDIGSGSSSVSINKDISAGYALDVSGITNLRNNLFVLSDVSFGTKLFVSGDSSFNRNLSVGQDLSLNGNLYVAKRALFIGDVSMNGNLKIGSGSSCFAINKDISAGFALDVSGRSQIRGNLDVSGVFTVNGAPVSGGGGSLTGNVQVGSNSGFVTINKPQFYVDPSLAIYYNFDTSYIPVGGSRTQIYNFGNLGSAYDASINSTIGLIIDGSQTKNGIASLKNNPNAPASNNGITICNINGSFPVSSTMTFSIWIYKPDTPPAGTFDRIFEISDLITSNTGNTENNTIALDVSSSGIIFPVLTTGTTSCFTSTVSNPIINYNVCNGVWNNIVWQITSTKSILYINGSNTQIDMISTPVPTTPRKSAFIANSYNLTNNRDFSGNLDDFRYYRDKALNYAEIYQLYNNNFYTLDICGGFLANGSSVIYEPIGSVATANRGTLTLLHGDASGSSSIMFKSVNDPLEYAYIEYDENATGSTGTNYGLMTIGIENDGGSGTTQADRISLFPSGGTGFVGVNTKTPQTALDISGQVRIFEGAGTTAAATGGSLTLEHATTGGVSSLVFKASNSSTTQDYAYVQYEDAVRQVHSIFKYDLSNNSPTPLTHATNTVIVPSTGTQQNGLEFYPIVDNSFVWLNTSTYTVGSINGVTPAYCLSFNQTNLLFTQGTTYNVPRINHLIMRGIPNSTGLPNGTSFTVSVWIRPTGLSYEQTGSGGRYIVLHSMQDGTGDVWVMQMYIEYGNTSNHPGRLYLLLNSDGTNYQLSNVVLTQNTWWHVAFTYNSMAKTGQLYLNGSTTNIDTPGTGFTGKTVNHNSIVWGHMLNASTYYKDKGFRGQMAFINVFDVALTADDITYLYDNPGYNFSNNNYGSLTIGIENDTGYINNDSIVLWPGAGKGFVGINTKNPQLTLDVSGQIQASSYNATSDYRTKDNVIKLDTSFTVDGLNPVTYQFKPTGKQDVGFLAHEVQELYPFLVNGVKDGPNNQSLNYNGFIGILTKEIKDLKKKVSEQEARIQALEKFILNK
jgi:hypothetical protein